jgi:hypothetical protein
MFAAWSLGQGGAGSRLLGLWLCMIKRGYPVSLCQGSFCAHGPGELPGHSAPRVL